MAASNGSAGPREVGTDEATYRPDELVVSLPYHRLISERLTSWRAQPYLAPGDEDKRLALARLSVDATTAVSHLRQEKPDWVAAAQASARARGHAPTELDVLLHCLRQAFQDEYSRWSPTMGKNRVVKRRVNGSYVIDGGGRRGPRPIRNYVLGQPRPGSWWRRPDSRKPVALRGVAPGSGTRVGVVDTRLSPHPWLAGGYVATADDLLSAEMEERQLIDHATFVTGLVLRQAPGTVVELRSGLDDEASQDSWTRAKTIARLAETTDVVNLSLGCVTEDGQPPLVLSAAIAALGPHTVVVAAAGNHGTQDGSAAPVWPAALDNVVAVGALDGSRPAEFSPEAPWVDALAPGVDVASTCDVSRRGKALFATWSGTSFAAAAVSGAIAAKIRDGRTPQEAWQRLQQKSDKDARGRVLVPLRTLSDWPPDRAA